MQEHINAHMQDVVQQCLGNVALHSHSRTASRATQAWCSRPTSAGHRPLRQKFAEVDHEVTNMRAASAAHPGGQGILASRRGATAGRLAYRQSLGPSLRVSRATRSGFCNQQTQPHVVIALPLAGRALAKPLTRYQSPECRSPPFHLQWLPPQCRPAPAEPVAPPRQSTAGNGLALQDSPAVGSEPDPQVCSSLGAGTGRVRKGRPPQRASAVRLVTPCPGTPLCAGRGRQEDGLGQALVCCGARGRCGQHPPLPRHAAGPRAGSVEGRGGRLALLRGPLPPPQRPAQVRCGAAGRAVAPLLCCAVRCMHVATRCPPPASVLPCSEGKVWEDGTLIW